MDARDQLSKAIQRLERQRALLLGAIEDLDQAQLDFKPSRQSWSIGQISQHIALGEVVWRGYLKNLLKDGAEKGQGTVKVSLNEVPFHSRFVPDFILRSPFVLGPLSVMIDLMPRPLQSMLFAVPLVKMDAGVRMQPRFGMSRTHVLKFLADTRKGTLDVIQPVSAKDLSRYRVIHPLVGDQNVYGVLELLASHEQRHTQQIEAIKRSSAFPGNDGTPY
jgi:hypothetical protein